MRQVASDYSIVSMGVACYQWQPESSGTVPCKVQVIIIGI